MSSLPRFVSDFVFKYLTMISMHIFAFDKVQLILIGLSSFEVLGVRESPVDISYFSKWQNSGSWDRPGMDPLSNI